MSGYIYAIAAAVTWGLVYVINAKILNWIDPLPLLFLESVITAAITFPFLLGQWNSAYKAMSSGGTFWTFLIFGELLITVANYFILSSVQHLGAPLAAAIEISYPLFVALFTAILFGGSLNLWFWFGTALIFSGSVIIMKFAQ